MLVLGLNVVHGFGFRREIESLGVSSGFECGACIWIQMGDSDLGWCMDLDLERRERV